MPTCQPNHRLNCGVTTGPSEPPALPPVFMTPAAVPPRRPPSWTAVVQEGPSIIPSATIAAMKQTTVNWAWVVISPATNRAALPMNPLTGKPVITTQGDIVSHWLAKNAYVFMESGSGFGKVGANFVRMNVATPRVTLKAGLDSVAAALKNLA